MAAVISSLELSGPAGTAAVNSAPDANAAGSDAANELEQQHQALFGVVSAPSLQAMARALACVCVEISGAQNAELTIFEDDVDNDGRTATGPLLCVQAQPGEPATAGDGDAETIIALEARGRSVGVLRLVYPQIAPPADWPLKRTRMLCEQASIGLAQTRRFEQLQRAKREWEQIFDGMVDGVCIYAPDGPILRANRALADMLGFRVTQIVGQTREELHARLPEYQMLRSWQRVQNGRDSLDVQTCEFRYGTPERVFIETRFSLRPAIGRGSTGNESHETAAKVCILREITEQRRLQDQLLQSEKLAALGELLSGVAHELNNPLATVVGYAQLLEGEPSLPPSALRQMQTIHKEAARAAHIVQNLLAFARRSEPEETRLTVNEVLATVVEMRAYQLQADDVRLVTEYGDDLPQVWGDPLELQQVFLNIINNAAHAMREWRGGGELRITTEAIAKEGVVGVRLTFADNGPGIAPDHLRRVFDPFFTTKRVGEGTGLGMSVSLRIISNHEGRIWAESRLGHGSSFIIELPGTDRASSAVAEPIEVSPHVGVQRRILVVDDEEPVVTLITEILALDGHVVTPAFNGAEALNLLKSHDFDLIVSDVRMPAVGGPTFFEVLQTTRPDLLPRVMFVTGDTVSASTRLFLQKSGRPMLAKPFDPQRLRALVAQTLAAQGVSGT